MHVKTGLVLFTIAVSAWSPLSAQVYLSAGISRYAGEDFDDSWFSPAAEVAILLPAGPRWAMGIVGQYTRIDQVHLEEKGGALSGLVEARYHLGPPDQPQIFLGPRIGITRHSWSSEEVEGATSSGITLGGAIGVAPGGRAGGFTLTVSGAYVALGDANVTGDETVGSRTGLLFTAMVGFRGSIGGR